MLHEWYFWSSNDINLQHCLSWNNTPLPLKDLTHICSSCPDYHPSCNFNCERVYCMYNNWWCILYCMYNNWCCIYAYPTLHNTNLMFRYSTVYTTAPVFSLVLDVDVRDDIALRYPELYKDLIKGRLLSYKTFFIWLLVSIYQGKYCFSRRHLV